MLPLRSDYVLTFLRKVSGARVSFIPTVGQELVSTPSCINLTVTHAWLGVILIFQRTFFLFRTSTEFTQYGHKNLHIKEIK